MAEKDLRKWSTFFHEAGVPSGPATEYATLFCDHRIKDDLLGDLTKEILNDIGITVMGDVMSILKHAKAIYAKLERMKSSNRLVQDSESVNGPSAKEDPLVLPSSQIKKKKLVAKLPNKPQTEVQQPAVLTSTARKKTTPAVGPKVTVTVDDSPKVPKKRPAKLTLSERFASETVSQPKVSRLSMEGSEATHKGTVKKVLTKTNSSAEKLTLSNKGAAGAPVKRKSAFERLGKEESSSVSKDLERVSPKIKITKLTKSPTTTPSSKVISLTKNESSVFKRLGETDPPPSSTTRTGALTIRTIRGNGSRVVSDDSPGKPAKSHSVLRPLKPIRAVQPVKPVSPVKARVSADTSKESSRKSVFSRLGSQT